MIIRPGLAAAQYPPDPGCPSTVPDYSSVPWNDGGCYTTTVDGCSVQLCYCYRHSVSVGAGVWDYVCTSVTFLGSCGLDPATIIADAPKQLVLDNPANLPCPSCPQYVFNYRAVAVTCWEETTAGETSSFTDCEGGGWCVQGYTVCCDASGARTILVSGGWAPLGLSVCAAYQAPKNWDWVLNQCYSVCPCCN
jgi:hypothetical protein